MLHEMYSANTIDLAYIGASPVYRGIDPAISDEMLNRNTFNLSSSAQTIVDSYYLLKETVKTHPDSIKTVIFHLSYTGMNDEESQRASVILIRYFKPSLSGGGISFRTYTRQRGHRRIRIQAESNLCMSRVFRRFDDRPKTLRPPKPSGT